MCLNKIGEFGFIERLSHHFDNMLGDDTIGIGDDCAVIPINETEVYVVTTDMLIEDTHFIKDKISATELGHKSLAVNLSDIAAMGAEPKFSFLSLGIPNNMPIKYLDDFMDGYKTLSAKYNTPLMGGDTTKSADKLIINVAVIGKCSKDNVRLRSMAKDTDIICVTNCIGDSAGGLHVLLKGLETHSNFQCLINKHHLPEPRINEGLWLANNKDVHAMMDISDGISSDLEHILAKSDKSANIYLEKIPISKQLQLFANQFGLNALNFAISGGEDYELLFTVNKDALANLLIEYANCFGKEIIPIGQITNNNTKRGINWLKNGKSITIDKKGFNHFT